MKMALERDVRLVRCEDGQLEIALEAERAEDLGARPVAQAHRPGPASAGWWWCRKEQGAPTVRAQMEAAQAELERGVQSDPLVQAVLNRFPGAKIVGVTQNAPAPRKADACPTAAGR